MTHDEHYDLMLHALYQIDKICLGVAPEPGTPMSNVYRIAHGSNMLCPNHQDWIDDIAKWVDGEERELIDVFCSDTDALKQFTWTKGGRP